LLEASSPSGELLQVSAGLEGAALADTGDAGFASGTGLSLRIGGQVDRWLLFGHVVVGQVDRARSFADPIVPNTDLIATTEESYLAYEGASGKWGIQFGRSRWHWGPGEEASLILSKTSAPITGLSYQVHFPTQRLDFEAISATLQQSAGQQLAAHRVEWQPGDMLRLGVTEAVRYKSPSWQPLYASGAIPYVIAQRLLLQDEPDSSRALHKEDMIGMDVACRITRWARAYGEVAIGDLREGRSYTPNIYAFQAGLEGVGVVGQTRFTWGGEFTRLTRYMYTSYDGLSFQAQDQPLGFPTGPDARRVALRGGWDIGPDWQLFANAAQTDKGQNGLGEPYIPGSPPVAASTFEGVVERTRELLAGPRWWPASGVDLKALIGWRWVDNRDHASGRHASSGSAALEVRLVR
jgi:hypothetical protein